VVCHVGGNTAAHGDIPGYRGMRACADSANLRWVESSLRWFREEFGTEVLSRDIVPPDAGLAAAGEVLAESLGYIAASSPG